MHNDQLKFIFTHTHNGHFCCCSSFEALFFYVYIYTILYGIFFDFFFLCHHHHHQCYHFSFKKETTHAIAYPMCVWGRVYGIVIVIYCVFVCADRQWLNEMAVIYFDGGTKQQQQQQQENRIVILVNVQPNQSKPILYSERLFCP